jgi:hypothetical protein
VPLRGHPAAGADRERSDRRLNMADHREVIQERLYLKEPRTERLRRSAEARLRYLLSTGWRETERWHANDYITVRVERSGHTPRIALPKVVAEPPRPPRQGQGRGPGQGPPGAGRPRR